jgi:dihydroneopterin aldolase
MDIIFLHDIRVDLIIGVYDWERKIPQTIQMDIDIGLPHSRAGQTDRVEDTIDYGAVVARVQASLAERHFSLVEALAEHVAQLILREFGAPWVKVSVAKLGLIRGVKRLGVTIERSTQS